MNPQPEANPPDPALTPLDSPPVSPEASKKKRRSHGKIAHLPKVLRHQVNSMLDDGFAYGLIIEKLRQSKDPPLPLPISEMNISRWKDTGYQHYLAHTEYLAELRLNREAALEIVIGDDTITLPEATLQIIASQYYELLGDFSPESLKEKLAEDPLKYTRFLNVFARLTREILNLKKHREVSAKAAALELKRLDPKRELNDREDEILSDTMDDFLLKPRRRRSDSADKKPEATPAEPAPTTDH